MTIYSSKFGMEDKVITSLGIFLLICVITLTVLVFTVIRLNIKLNMLSESSTYVFEESQPGNEYVCFPVNSGTVANDIADSFIPPID